MKPRLVIITEIISPYRIPLFNSLAQRSEAELHVIFLAENDPVLRQWKIYRDEIRFSYEVLPSWRRRVGPFNVLLNQHVIDSLRQASPDAILCGGYNYVASWQALLWARFSRIPFLLWSESNQYDNRSGSPPIELLKTEFLRRCDGFVVPGREAGAYLQAYGIREHKIFTAPNAVDNDLFRSSSLEALKDPAKKRRSLGLPESYMLFVGRLVPEKGVFELLRAYAQLDKELRRRIGLVFVGDGPSRQELQKEAAGIPEGTIRFPGFAQREDLPAYYALAEMLVLPTYTDTWGLVVNEAMACGLPVIVSRVAGCVTDLIHEGSNGLLVRPRDISSLASAITFLVDHPNIRRSMGSRAAEHIGNFSPTAWSIGIEGALHAILNSHD